MPNPVLSSGVVPPTGPTLCTEARSECISHMRSNSLYVSRGGAAWACNRRAPTRRIPEHYVMDEWSYSLALSSCTGTHVPRRRRFAYSLGKAHWVQSGDCRAVGQLDVVAIASHRSVWHWQQPAPTLMQCWVSVLTISCSFAGLDLATRSTCSRWHPPCPSGPASGKAPTLLCWYHGVLPHAEA